MTTTEQPFTQTTSTSGGRQRSLPTGPTNVPFPQGVVVLESCHSTWIFDPRRLQFRRLLKGVEIGSHRVLTDWRPYWQVRVDPEGEGFTVYLNSSRTRLIRSWRHSQHCSQCRGSDTAELSLEDIRLTLHGVAIDARGRSPSQ
jgi:hypothetical protein